MRKLISEASNAPVSFLGGIIAICGLLYSLYVFALNGDLPSLPFGNYVFKFLILILIEAPLAYFFVQIHVHMAEKGHGLPLFLNLFTIIVSALISCFNVSILSYQSMLSGSITYYVVMVIFSLFCASYLLIIEIQKQKRETFYQVNLDALREFRRQDSISKLWKKLAPLRSKYFLSFDATKAAIEEVTQPENRDSEFGGLLKLLKEEEVNKVPELWQNWIIILLIAYICAFAYCSFSVFPDVYGKACTERYQNGESLEVLYRYTNNCDHYVDLLIEE